MDKETEEKYTMAASDAATAIINSIKVAAHEHPPGISKKPVYDISTFLPFSDDVYRLNGSIDYELAVKEYDSTIVR